MSVKEKERSEVDANMQGMESGIVRQAVYNGVEERHNARIKSIKCGGVAGSLFVSNYNLYAQLQRVNKFFYVRGPGLKQIVSLWKNANAFVQSSHLKLSLVNDKRSLRLFVKDVTASSKDWQQIKNDVQEVINIYRRM
ncbi:hypothetical protein ACXR0M_03790 [Pseudomonas sp. Eth.TT006]